MRASARIFCTFHVTGAFNWNSLLDPRTLYLTPGLWDPGASYLSMFKVYFSYAATGLILIPLLTHLEKNVFGLLYYLITRINIPISVPVNDLLNKFFAYRALKKDVAQ